MISGGDVQAGTAYILVGDKATVKFYSDAWYAVGGFQLYVTAVSEGNCTNQVYFITFNWCKVK